MLWQNVQLEFETLVKMGCWEVVENKLPLTCNVDLDAVATSDTPADPALVARFHKLSTADWRVALFLCEYHA